MKKFSWIFALILALSIGFIGCPASDDDDTPPPPPPAGYVPNPAATDIVVTFDATNTVEGNNGTITFPTGGYQYTYGTVANSNYGNGIVRFKVNLGQMCLADYGSVEFKWQGVSGDAASNKKLYLLATDDEAAITPYQDDGAIKSLVVSSNAWAGQENPGAPNFWGETGAPNLNGTGEEPVVLPILYKKDLEYLTREVWFAVYSHCSDGAYIIKDFTLVAGVYTPPPPPPPPPESPPATIPPVDIPDGLDDYTLDLFDRVETGYGAGAPATVTPATGTPGTPIVAVFTDANDRLVVNLTSALKTAITSRVNDKIYVEIDGSVTAGDDKDFRYHIGDATAPSNWNATGGSNNYKNSNNEDIGAVALNKILKIPLTFNTNSGVTESFILQRTSAGPVTVTINSIKIYVIPVADKVVSLTGVTAVGSATIDEANATNYTFTTTAGYGPGSTFAVEFSTDDSVTLSSYTRLSFSFEGLSGDTGYKKAKVAISGSAITSLTETGFFVESDINGEDSSGAAAKKTVTIYFPATVAPAIDLKQVNVAIYFWSAAASWKISDVKFHN